MNIRTYTIECGPWRRRVVIDETSIDRGWLCIQNQNEMDGACCTVTMDKEQLIALIATLSLCLGKMIKLEN